MWHEVVLLAARLSLGYADAFVHPANWTAGALRLPARSLLVVSMQQDLYLCSRGQLLLRQVGWDWGEMAASL